MAEVVGIGLDGFRVSGVQGAGLVVLEPSGAADRADGRVSTDGIVACIAGIEA